MRRFWAVARMTILESLRSRFAVVFAALLALCVLGVGLSFEGDGTLKGRIQTFLDYTTTLTQLLLGLLTLLLGAFVTTRDIRTKTVYTVASKPLSRAAYVAGRWLGIVLLDAVLLATALGAIYGLAQYLRTLPTATDEKKRLGLLAPEASDPERLAVNNAIFTARAQINPDPFDVAEQVKQDMDRLFEERDVEELIRDRIRLKLAGEGQKQPGEPIDEAEVERRAGDPRAREAALAEIKALHRRRIIERRQIVQRNGTLRLDFSGVRIPPGKDRRLYLRYRLRPLRRPDSGLLKSTWIAHNPKTGVLQDRSRDDPTEMVSSIEIRPELVTPDHRLTIYYNNDPRNPTAVKVIPSDITLLYRVGSFEGNLARAGAIMLLRLMFLAAVGVLFGVFLSFPVACLACLYVFFLGCMGNFAQEAASLPTYTEPGPLDYFSYGMSQLAFFFLPNLPVVSSPAGELRDGTMITWGAVAAEAAKGTGVRALVALALGGLIFWRRELARVQV